MSEARGDDETENATTRATTGEGDGQGDTDPSTGGRPCPHCDRPMIHRHCKYVCPEHGVVYDCSDTFY